MSLSSKAVKRGLILVAVLLGFSVLWKSCTLSDDELRTTRWKYNDDERGGIPETDFLHFDNTMYHYDRKGLVLRDDTIFRADTVVGVVHRAYRKLDGVYRLVIKILPSERTVEYSGI